MCAFVHCVGNLMVNVDQQRDLQRQNQEKTNNVITALTLWCGCVTIVDVEK
jgi:hypothetical protein